MPFDPLAAVTDLPDRWSDTDKNDQAIAAASDAIRAAAGVPISRETATVVLDGTDSAILRLPGPIVHDSVTGVTLDGKDPGPFRVVAEGLWRRGGWAGWEGEPLPVTVTYTFGLPEVPADVADLCIQLAIAWLEHDQDGGGTRGGLQSVRLDDAMEQYTSEGSGQVTPMFVPDATARWLRARFNAGGAYVVGSY